MKSLCFKGSKLLLPVILLGIFSCFTSALQAGEVTGVTVVSPALGAALGAGNDATSPCVSSDGRYVLFASKANNLVLTGANIPIAPIVPPQMNVYLRDRINKTTTLVSVNMSGTGGGNGDSFPVCISTNGQFVLFESYASNLVAGVISFHNNIYVRDVVNGTNVLVSVNTNGVSGNGDSRTSVMTPDGRYVAFISRASDLVAGDTNGIADVFVRDLQQGVTVLASPGAMGSMGNESQMPDITPDGHYVAFYSLATNLVAGVTTSPEIYVRDLFGGTTIQASASAHTIIKQQLNSTNCLSLDEVISDDGQYITYLAETGITSNGGIILRYNQFTGHTDVVATNAAFVLAGSVPDHCELDMTPDGRFISYIAVASAANYTTAIWQWDALSNTTNLVSGTYTNGNVLPASSICVWPMVATNGRYVTFVASAPGITTNSDSSFHVYERDMQAGVTQLIDTKSNGLASAGGFSIPSMSEDGSVVAFESQDTALFPGNNNRAFSVYAVNPTLNTTELISSAHPDLPSITPNGESALSVTSVNGNARYIAFSSDASNIVPNDTNKCRDVFVRDTLLNSNFLASVDTNGIFAGNLESVEPSISIDGRYVAFSSSSSNLVVGDTNNHEDVFVRDLQLGITTLVSVNTNGTNSGNQDSFTPTISTNGRYVLFHSKASNLASGGSLGYDNLYWRDTQAHVTRIFTAISGSPTYCCGAMTPDGQYVVSGSSSSSSPLTVWNAFLGTKVYTNSATTVMGVGISPNGSRIGYALTAGQVYAVDLVSNTTVNIGGAVIPPRSTFAFSGDSRFMVYVGTNSGYCQIYLYDFVNLTNVLISQSTNGVAGNGTSDMPVISSEGRFIAYHSFASNLGPGATNGISNVYLYDSQSGNTILLSGAASPIGRSTMPIFSADAQTLVFASWDPNWTAQNFNQGGNIFTLSLYSSNAQPAFSAGILPAAANGQSPAITWTITPGSHYEVQFKNQLSDPVWQSLNGNVTLSGNQETMTDPAPSTAQRFYRIVAY